MKVKILLVVIFLVGVSSIYLLRTQSPVQNTDLITPVKTDAITAQQTNSAPELISTAALPQQPEGEITAALQQDVSTDQPLTEQLCASYTKPVCQLKDDIQLQQQLLRNNNLFMDSAALVIGSSNYSDALLQLSASKTASEDFSIEQDIQDYLTKELSGEVYTLQLGCGEGICMASISTGPNSDIGQDLSTMQGLGSSVMAEFEHSDHKEIRLIFLAGKNANNGMTGTAKNTAAPTNSFTCLRSKKPSEIHWVLLETQDYAAALSDGSIVIQHRITAGIKRKNSSCQ